jgi:putative salt-induced outer membrane protein YdiY
MLKSRNGVGFIAVIVVAATMCLALPVLASEVVMVNGDKLTGTIDTISGGKMQFHSPMLGKIEIDMIYVQSVSSDESVTVVLSDGRTVVRRLGPALTGKVTLHDEKEKQEVAWGDIKAINPPPPVWKGSVSGAWTLTSGNTKSQSTQASISLTKREESSRITLNGDYGRVTQRDNITRKDNTTEDWWRIGGKYDYFLTKKLYGYVEERYATDKIAKIDQRIISAAGLGYQWIESKGMNFSTDAGLAYISEKYTGDGNNDRLSAQLGYHFDKQLTDTLTFRHDLTYFPSLKRFTDYYLTTSLELRAGLTKSMFANFRTILDYNSQPAAGKDTTDIKYMLGVGWDF